MLLKTKVIPLFSESYALSSHQARSWARQALDEGHSAVLHGTQQSSAPGLGWAGENWSSPSPLSQQESKVQEGTKPEGISNLWLVWRRESCVLVHSAQIKSALKNFLREYGRETYTTYTNRILSSLRLAISLKWTSGQSWRNSLGIPNVLSFLMYIFPFQLRFLCSNFGCFKGTR